MTTCGVIELHSHINNMKKLILTILFLFVTTLSYAEWKLNPTTEELDYYESSSGSGESTTVTDTATIDLTLTDSDIKADLITPQQVVVVAKAGGDYTTIQGAIDSITDNAANKPYVVIIYPGTYTENITMEDFVSLDGEGKRGDIVIDGTVTFASDAGDKAVLKDLSVKETTTTTGLDLITSPNSTGQHSVDNCLISLTNTDNGDVGTLIEDSGGTLKLRNSKFVYNFDGTAVGANLHNVINLSGTVTYDIYDSDIDIDFDDADDTVVGINEAAAGTITESIMRNTIMHMNANHGTYTGACGLFYLHGAGTEKWYQSNHVHLESTGGGTAYGIYIDTTGDNGMVHTTANQIHISGFTHNYGLNVAGGDTVFSHFDDVKAASGNTGLGTVTAVQSPSDGNFLVTGTTNIGGTLNVGGALIEDSNVENLVIRTNSVANQLVLDLDGSVGIGIAEPETKLHVQLSDTTYSWTPLLGTVAIIEGNTNTQAILTIAGGLNYKTSIWFGDNSLQNAGRLRYEHNSNKMEFWTNNGERASIDSSGNFVVGDASAEALVDIGGGTPGKIDGVDDLLVKDDVEIDGDLYVEGSFFPKQVDDDAMDATDGTEGEIVYNLDDDKFYGCTATGTPATWAAFH